jgi:hypothetical protein
VGSSHNVLTSSEDKEEALLLSCPLMVRLRDYRIRHGTKATAIPVLNDVACAAQNRVMKGSPPARAI